jgi:hypothetical protein
MTQSLKLIIRKETVFRNLEEVICNTLFVFVIGFIWILFSNSTDHIKGLPDEFLLDCFQTAVLLKHFSRHIEW